MAIDKSIAVQDVDYPACASDRLDSIRSWKAPAETKGWEARPQDARRHCDRDEKAVRPRMEREFRYQAFLGLGYLTTANARDGKSSIAFRADVPASGSYMVRVLYPPSANRATTRW